MSTYPRVLITGNNRRLVQTGSANYSIEDWVESKDACGVVTSRWCFVCDIEDPGPGEKSAYTDAYEQGVPVKYVLWILREGFA